VSRRLPLHHVTSGDEKRSKERGSEEERKREERRKINHVVSCLVTTKQTKKNKTTTPIYNARGVFSGTWSESIQMDPDLRVWLSLASFSSLYACLQAVFKM